MADQPKTPGGPSFSLLLAGVLGVLVSVWAFVGPSAWPINGIVPMGWIVVAVAIVIGVALVVSPRRTK